MSKAYQARNGKLEELGFGDGIPRAGDRGLLAGSEQASAMSGSQAITKDSPDCVNLGTSGDVKLTFTPAGANECAVKIITLAATAATNLTVEGAVWANGADAPVWGEAGKTLVLTALFAGGRVILNVADNTQ